MRWRRGCLKGNFLNLAGGVMSGICTANQWSNLSSKPRDEAMEMRWDRRTRERYTTDIFNVKLSQRNKHEKKTILYRKNKDWELTTHNSSISKYQLALHLDYRLHKLILLFIKLNSSHLNLVTPGCRAVSACLFPLPWAPGGTTAPETQHHLVSEDRAGGGRARWTGLGSDVCLLW